MQRSKLANRSLNDYETKKWPCSAAEWTGLTADAGNTFQTITPVCPAGRLRRRNVRLLTDVETHVLDRESLRSLRGEKQSSCLQRCCTLFNQPHMNSCQSASSSVHCFAAICFPFRDLYCYSVQTASRTTLHSS